MGRGGAGGGHGGGGHSGGGRSSGGGGRSSARSSGGRSAGASRGGYAGRAASGGSRASRAGARPGAGPRRAAGFGGNFGPPPGAVPPLHGMPLRRRRRRGSSYRARTARGAGGSAFAALAAFFFFFIAIIAFAIASSSHEEASPEARRITNSTVKREKLPAQYATATEWYTDELGWIKSGSKLTAGMRSFYNKTGVAPYIYITDTVNGTTSPSDADMEVYAQALYEALFADEGHILLLFYEHNEDSNYKTRYVCGDAAKIVMDKEACDILLDYVDAYYYSDLEDDEMFSTAFEKAGERIMSVTRSPAPFIVIALIALAIVAVAFAWWRRGVEQHNREAEEWERVLNADINSVEDPALKDLEEKYKDPN